MSTGETDVVARLHDLAAFLRAARVPVIGLAGETELRHALTAVDAADLITRLRSQGAVPEGWKLVPVEPTVKILRSISAACRNFYDENGPYPRAKAVYRAMLSASPPASAAQQEGDATRIIARPLRYEPTGHADSPAIKDANAQLVASLFWPLHEAADTERAEGELHLIASRMTAAANEIDPDDDDVYEIGRRDGYESAVQDIDHRTGGDGEFRGSTIPGRTVDVSTMFEGIVDRFDGTLSAAVAAERARVIEIAERWAAAEACGAENAARECLAAIRALGKGGAGNG